MLQRDRPHGWQCVTGTQLSAGNKALHLIDDLAKYGCAAGGMYFVTHCELVYHYNNTH